MTDVNHSRTANLISLLNERDDLLSDDAWEPIEPDVPTDRDAGAFICQAAPPGVAEIDKPDDKVAAGFQQRVELNQSVPAVIVASVESRSDDLAFRRVFDYALAITLLDEADQTIASAFTPFADPSIDWQRAELRIVPPRPVKTAVVRLCCLCQAGHGAFRSPKLVQLTDDDPCVSLDGMALPAGTDLTAGWHITDVKDERQLIRAEAADQLGLSVSTTRDAGDDALHSEATVGDLTGTDRALTVVYVRPLADGPWRWLGSLREDSPTASPGEYVTTAQVLAGRGQLSRWPLAAVANGADGQAISLDMTQPAVYRVGYSAGANALFIAFDIALTPEKPQATLAAEAFAFDGACGFRGAIQRMYERQPDAFADRTGGHGLWAPFLETTAVEDHEDFGFRFKEGIGGDLRWGNETGKLLTFHYIEPLTFWVAMDEDIPRDMDHAMAAIDALKADGNHEALAFETSVYHRPSGRPTGIAVDAAWCNGIVWSMNSAPGIEQPSHFASILNDEKIANWVEDPDPLANVSGWYIDSIEGYITEDLDYTRGHFAAMATPLSYDRQTYQPVVFTGLVVYEFTRRLAEELRRRGRLTMANTVPGRYCWLAPYLDVLGTETNWNHEGAWTPLTDAEMLYRRALTGDKPYCFLMNSDFSKFTYDMTERYMKRCVAYGMYPGYFSPNAFSDSYFGNADWYNRDRELFKRYVPLCKRVGEAGWKPVTNARSSDEGVYVERWGGDTLTVFNDAGETRTVTVTLEGDWPATCRDVVSDGDVAVDGDTLTLTLGHEDVAVLAFA